MACFSDHSPRVLKRGSDQLNIDALLESLFAVSDPSLIDASFDSLVKSRYMASDQNELMQRALHLGSVVLEAGKRHIRKCSSIHNASVWPLPTDLTIKVFSMLDAPSVCYAAATCSLFEKCARNRLCYANIDLTALAGKVTDHLVTTLIQRADNAIRSLKLRNRFDYDDECGYRRSRQEKESPILTTSCLSSLSAIGSCLRRLHLDNIERMDDKAICASLSVCPSLIDLKIEGMNLDINNILKIVSRRFPLIERFIFKHKYKGSYGYLDGQVCEKFVRKCPNITTLALKSCRLSDSVACELVKGFCWLKRVDFSDSMLLNGAFLTDLCKERRGGKNLEVIILRECWELKKYYVKKFMKALLDGNFRRLRHIDVYEDDYEDAFEYTPSEIKLSSTLLLRLSEKRPSLRFVDKNMTQASLLSMSTSGSSYKSDLE